MNDKFFIGIGAAFFLVFFLGIAVVMGFEMVTDQPSHLTAAKPADKPLPVASSLPPAPEVQTPAPSAELTLAAQPTPSPLIVQPANPTPVADSDLVQLAEAVNLGGTNPNGVSKEVWAREVPVAERLLQGICDCDQRNWLKHFVETGNEALSGSEDYFQSIQVLTKLRRNDQDLTESGPSQ